MGSLVHFARNNEIRTALSAAGMASGEFNLLEAEIRTVQEAASASVGHRPPGTAEVVASMVAEGRCAVQIPDAKTLQTQLDAFKVEAEELQRLWADMDQDLGSDTESAAPSESGDLRDAHRQRKAERAEIRAAKRKKLGDKLKVVSKFGSA